MTLTIMPDVINHHFKSHKNNKKVIYDKNLSQVGLVLSLLL